MDSQARWYVVQVFSNYEKQVADYLREQVSKKGLQSLISEILVPTEEVIEVRKGKKVAVQRKFFPGYILIKAVMNEEVWHLIKQSPRVTGFIGGNSTKPVPVTEKEVASIMGHIKNASERVRVSVDFEIGEHVKVIDGPFASFVGMVEAVDEENSRLQVSVLIFGRATPVDLEYFQVEKVG